MSEAIYCLRCDRQLQGLKASNYGKTKRRKPRCNQSP